MVSIEHSSISVIHLAILEGLRKSASNPNTANSLYVTPVPASQWISPFDQNGTSRLLVPTLCFKWEAIQPCAETTLQRHLLPFFKAHRFFCNTTAIACTNLRWASYGISFRLRLHNSKLTPILEGTIPLDLSEVVLPFAALSKGQCVAAAGLCSFEQLST